jgi:lysophospholipase-3
MGTRAAFLIFPVLLTYVSGLPPLVVVPGLLGSQLQAKLDKPNVVHSYCSKTSDWYTLWLNVEQLLPFVINCFVDNARMVYNASTGSFASPPGVSIRVPGFGNMSSIEYLDPSLKVVGSYFNTFVEEMEAIGYISGVSMRGAPYDWRLAPPIMSQFYDELKQLIETTYKANNGQKVILVSHSLGCLQTLYFLSQYVASDWKSQFISSWIPIAGPWAGTAQIMRDFASGGNEQIVFVDPITVRPQQRSFLSMSWLLPTPSLWNKSPIIITPEHNYTVDQYDGFFKDIGYPLGKIMLDMVSNLTQSLPVPGVPVYCVHGANVSTPNQFKYDNGFPNSQPTVLTGNGDGTVNLESLVLCGNWKGKQQDDVTVTVFPDISHFKLVSNMDVINYVKSVIQQT